MIKQLHSGCDANIYFATDNPDKIYRDCLTGIFARATIRQKLTEIRGVVL
ncbi:hypothetical protein [Iningainema tapete]|uniref:Uncharacterized protein n=1 Tax=Iningainema tapete BLCC-T55 TaxID=2748662 RepID=A0A8J6XPM1_9CYAN|nr:hypothetical protein [Iningainema tapete]MBD2777132.1 hypothetical protein [Iningainema tapete BLCC-T55]